MTAVYLHRHHPKAVKRGQMLTPIMWSWVYPAKKRNQILLENLQVVLPWL